MLPIYRGHGKQYGYGVGGIFKKASRHAIPLIKPLLKQIKDEVLNEGLGAMTDIIAKGLSPEEVVKKRGLKTIKKIGHNILSDLAINTKKKKKNKHSKKNKRSDQSHNSLSRPLDIFD